MLELTNKNIYLRAVEPEDLLYIHSIENNTEIWNISNTLTPFSKYEIKQYIESSQLGIYTNKQLRLIICHINNNKPIGTIDLFDFDPYHKRAGIGILISDKNERKKGFAKESLETLINYCFSFLDLNQLYCNILSDNSNSIKLFTEAGFREIGTKYNWVKTTYGWKDEIMFQLLRE